MGCDNGGRQHLCRAPAFRHRAHVGPSSVQKLDRICVLTLAREQQRRPAIVVGVIGVGAAVEQLHDENRDTRGATKMRLRKPNSRSNSIGNPELSALLKAVNTMIPAAKNCT